LKPHWRKRNLKLCIETNKSNILKWVNEKKYLKIIFLNCVCAWQNIVHTRISTSSAFSSG
jgi:hypothetical protein